MAINKNYLQLEYKTGLFFEYSGTEKQGYEKYTSKNGNVSYRKYYKDGISGVLESVSIYDGKFGKQISMNIKDGDDVYYVPVDIFDQSKNVDSNYAESLIKLLPNLKKGSHVAVRGYNFIPEDKKYANIGISIKQEGEKVERALSNAYYKKDGSFVEGDIPAIKWVDKLGKKTPSLASLEVKDDFLISIVEKETERLKWVGQEQQQTSNSSTPPPVPTATPDQAFEPVSDLNEDDYNDLPFN